MDIKLRAKLAAYSKVTSIGSNIPTPSVDNAGDVVGVNDEGKYTLFSKVTHEQIDSLFEGQLDKSRVVTKDEIDTLFEDDTTKPYATVSRSQIDSLFS